MWETQFMVLFAFKSLEAFQVVSQPRINLEHAKANH